jgi:hopene-associated glycosyltransferase HpnB
VVAEILATIAVAIWLYLLVARGAFWLCRERDDQDGQLAPAGGSRQREWPHVAAVVPARDEADSIGKSIGSLLAQDYPGPWTVILVDDDSSDGTADIARGVSGAAERLRIVSSRSLPAGWTGKLWAVKQGIDAAMAPPQPPDYLLLTDADIVHAPDSVRHLVAHAEAGHLVLTSLMVKLRCESLAERINIPAFIFFFQMLYPFAWVNRPARRTAAAAGGCMLVNSLALQRAGGLAAVRGELIDDCALARLLKAQAPIQLALTHRVRSERGYHSLIDVRRMIGRSAYAQLRYSPLLLLLTTLGMLVTYVAPPALAIFGHGVVRVLGAAAWIMMTLAFQPTLRFYRVSPLWGAALPAIALAYLVFTLDSAYQAARGRAGLWKGRVYPARKVRQ